MKAFRLTLSPSGELATPLHFLDRSDCTRYQKMLLAPWEALGYYQSPAGEKIPLAKVQLRIEPALIPGIFDADLDWIVWRKDGALGYVPLVPGRCFDAGAWRPVTDQDRRDPTLAPKLANAERELNSQSK